MVSESEVKFLFKDVDKIVRFRFRLLRRRYGIHLYYNMKRRKLEIKVGYFVLPEKTASFSSSEETG